MVASSSAAKAAKTNNHKKTGSTAKTTDFKKKAKEPPTPAQRRAKQAVDKRYRANKKRRFEELEQENLRMVAELEENNSEIIRITNENQELRRALERKEAIVEQTKQIPCAWKVDGTNFASFDEAVNWFTSQRYGQGSDPKDTNITTSAAAGPSFANQDLPNNAPDNNPLCHDPAAGFSTASAAGSFFAAYPELDHLFDGLDNRDINVPFTEHDLAAAGSSLVAGHESPVMFDAPNYHDSINNLSAHDPAAGFPSASAAGSSSYDIGGFVPRDPAADNKAGFPKSHL